MKIAQLIEQKLRDQFKPVHLAVINESSAHQVPDGAESHFKIIIASDQFSDQSRLAQHRMVNKVLARELATQIHALALHTYTPEEWQNSQTAPLSPRCHGGQAKEKFDEL